MTICGHISANLGVKNNQALDHEELGYHAADGCSACQDLHVRMRDREPSPVQGHRQCGLPRPPPRSPAWQARVMDFEGTSWEAPSVCSAHQDCNFMRGLWSVQSLPEVMYQGYSLQCLCACAATASRTASFMCFSGG